MRALDLPQGFFKVLGEHPALDLLNSVDVVRGQPVDIFDNGERLVDWAVVVGLLEGDEADEVRRNPNGAGKALADTIALRELLRAELTNPGSRSRELASLLNRMLPKPLVGTGSSSVGLGSNGLSPSKRLLARLALYVADLLLCVPRERIRQCQSPTCTWFFLDQSGGRRQWCVMSGCGNAAKARRHRARTRSAACSALHLMLRSIGRGRRASGTRASPSRKRGVTRRRG
jgi:predicted RNA-binding Zn ribbon-like protein